MKSSFILFSLLPCSAFAQQASVTAVLQIIDSIVPNPTLDDLGVVYPIGTAADGHATTYEYEYVNTDMSTTTIGGSITSEVPAATLTMVEGTLVAAPSSWHFEAGIILAPSAPTLHSSSDCTLLSDGTAQCVESDETFQSISVEPSGTSLSFPPISTRIFTSRGTPQAELIAISTRSAGSNPTPTSSGSASTPKASGKDSKDNAALSLHRRGSRSGLLSTSVLGLTLGGIFIGVLLVL